MTRLHLPRWRMLPLLALLALPNGAVAQVRTADPIRRGLQLTDFPRFVKLADNVYGYEEIRQPGFTTVSLVVIGRDGVLIADGQGNLQATQTMLDRIRTLSPLPVRWYVAGSDHGDHTGGNAALPKDVTMITSADLTNNERSIDVGGTTVRVLFLGRAHTGTDLSVHLPRERILFMSEAYLNRVFPAMRSAFPSEWVGVVDRALAMDVDRFVPGHGFIEEPKASREELVAFRDALVYVNAEVKRLHGLGLSAADAPAQANWGRYAEWFLREQQAPIAVRKVYEEIEGKLPPPSNQQQPPNAVAQTFKSFGRPYGAWLIAAFDSIPASKYEYRPTPVQQSVGYIAQHLEDANYQLCQRFGSGKRAVSAKDSLADTVKARWPKDTLVARLRASLVFCGAEIDRLTDANLSDRVMVGPAGAQVPVTRARDLILLVTDLAEHYAQIASYMRQLGLVPPSALPPPRR